GAAPAPVTAPRVPPPGPAPMPPPIATVAEFIEELATYRLGRDWTVVTMERLMAALVRFVHADRAGLATALESAGISKAAGWRHDAVWVASAALAGIRDADQRPHDIDAALIRQRRALLDP